MTYRCIKHDLVFETQTDHRAPGAGETKDLEAHPEGGGHPDCPRCQNDAAAEAAPAKKGFAPVR